ncbi:MAG: LURP-one-related family protein [Eubacterium sp.]|nr:LURP-one-related family protein [Eubacterium sp.]
MKLYMKQKVFSFKDKFTIKDEQGNDKYYIEGEFLSLGKKLHIYDMNHNEVAFVRQKILAFMPKFTVEVNGSEVAEIVKRVTFFTPKYYVDGLGWNVEGDFFAHNYIITSGDRAIVSIHKAWMSWGDTFELDIADDRDEVTALAVVLAIDAVMDSQNNIAAQ